MNIKDIIEDQQSFFKTNETKNISFRISQLKMIKKLLKENEEMLCDAIHKDFGKSAFETYTTELSMIYSEIDYSIKNIVKWSKRQSVPTGLTNFPAKSYIIPEPLGTTLVISTWNYPFQLSFIPAIAALAAGNTVILKPSELTTHSSAAMAKLINDHFPHHYFYVYEGGVQETTAALEHRFDKIFFTGSTEVGRIIYQAAAKHLTPVTLELGGKCPTFVLADCNIKVTAKRIIWSKYLNAGQTCIAPDYLLVDEAIHDPLLDALMNEIKKYHFEQTDISENYSRIINTRHFDRLCQFINEGDVCFGGTMNRANRFISPTIMKDITFDDDVMKDEIFGPILPIISYKNLDEVVKKVKDRPKPLACYIYSKNRQRIDQLLNEISFGGGAINDSAMQMANIRLPFGGVGLSGMGSYHGKAGFDTFSHHKSILDKPFWFEPFVKYPPYTKTKKRILKWLLE